MRRLKAIAATAAAAAALGIIIGLQSLVVAQATTIGQQSMENQPGQAAATTEPHATILLESPAEVVDLRKNPEKEPEPTKEEEQPQQYESKLVAPGITEDDAVLIYYCIEAEAGNQSELVKRLCVDVIINRMHDESWPGTIYGVITEEGQFSVWTSGAILKAIPTEETIAAVNMELEKQINNEIVYFNSIGFIHGAKWEKVGDMYFATKKKEETK